MEVSGMATVLPVDDVAAAAKIWALLLGVQPTFVDGDRWAQFDVAGRRLALAGTDRVSSQAGVMIKVDDLAAVRAAALAAGVTVGDNQDGPHEIRFTALAPGGWPATFYAPRNP